MRKMRGVYVCSYGVVNCPICPVAWVTGRPAEEVSVEFYGMDIAETWKERGWLGQHVVEDNGAVREWIMRKVIESGRSLEDFLVANVNPDSHDEFRALYWQLVGATADEILQQAALDREAEEVVAHLQAMKHRHIQADPVQETPLLDSILADFAVPR